MYAYQLSDRDLIRSWIFLFYTMNCISISKCQTLALTSYTINQTETGIVTIVEELECKRPFKTMVTKSPLGEQGQLSVEVATCCDMDNFSCKIMYSHLITVVYVDICGQAELKLHSVHIMSKMA